MIAFANPWGLLALLAVLPIIVAHLWRRRRAQVTVSTLFLFARSTIEGQSGGRPQPLRQRLSLWLELLAVLALALWLSDPHWQREALGRHLIVVIDDHRRLDLQDEEGVSVADTLRRELAESIRRRGDIDRLSIVRSGSPPRVIAGPMANVGEALLSLDDWRPQSHAHDYGPTWQLVLQLAEERAEVLWAGDYLPPSLPAGWGHLLRGSARAHAGLVGVRAVKRSADLRLAVVAEAFHGPLSRELRLEQDGQTHFAETLELLPGRPLLREITVAQAGDYVLHLASVGQDEGDALPWDDQLSITLTAQRPVRTWIDMPTGPIRQAWQRVLPLVGATLLAEDEKDGAELLVSDGPESDGLSSDGQGSDELNPEVWSLRISPGDAPPVFGPFLTQSAHPLLAGVDTTGLLWSGAAQGLSGAEVLVRAGDSALMVWDNDERPWQLVWHIDPTRSNLIQHPAFPALAMQLVAERRRHRPGPDRAWLLPGELLQVQLPVGSRQALLVGPDGQQQTLLADRQGRIGPLPLQTIGEWSISAAGQQWSVRLLPSDPAQLRVPPGRWEEQAPRSGHDSVLPRQRHALAHLLPLLALIAAALGAWWAFGREQGAS